MSITQFENNLRKMNILEESEILKQPPPNTYSMMLSQDKTTECTNSPSQETKEISKPNN